MEQELLNKIKLLEDENEKLKKQLENYNNSRKTYYEKNKEIVNQKAKDRLKKLSEENPEKLKEIMMIELNMQTANWNQSFQYYSLLIHRSMEKFHYLYD